MASHAAFSPTDQTQSVLDALAAPTAITDAGGVITTVNVAWRRFCEEAGREHVARADAHEGAPHAEVCGPLQGLSQEEARACHQGVCAVSSGALPGFRLDYRREERNSLRAYTMNVSPLAGGGALITHADVTESRAAEAKFARLFEAPIDALVVADEHGHIAMVNAQTEAMFGYARGELLGQPLDTLLPERLRGQHARHRARYHADPRARPMGTGLELLAQHKGGSEFPVEISLTPLETGDQTLISAAIRDVSDVTLAKAQAARLGRVLESSLNEIYLFDARTLRFSLVNEGGRRNLGYSMVELAGLTLLDLELEHDRASFEALVRPLRAGAHDTLLFHTSHRRKDGTRYPVEVHLQLFRDEKPPLFAAVVLDTTERIEAARALRASERRVALHVEHTPLAVIEWDTGSRLLTAWNPAAERVFGYRAEEVLGRHTADLLVTGEVSEKLEGGWQDEFGEGGLRTTHRTTTKGGRIVTCEWYATPLKDEQGRVARVAALVLDVTARQRALDALLTAQEEERGRISRDLHDQVGQSLTATLLNISSLDEHFGGERLGRLKDLTLKTLEDVRRISRDLRPALLDELGLEAALGRFTRELAAQSGVKIDLLVRLPARSPRNVEVVIYRVVQEALTNVVRHARARNASVVVTADGERVRLVVEDDGAGFDPANLSAADHVGLAGMRERLELLGGSLRIESSKGRGTVVSARVPLHT